MPPELVNVVLVKLHDRLDLLEACIELLNSEWPRPPEMRSRRLLKSSDRFPMCLVLVDVSNSSVLAFAKLTAELPFNPVVFIESVIVRRDLRGLGLGRRIMEESERIVKQAGLNRITLTTTDQVEFYERLGYRTMFNGKDGKHFSLPDQQHPVGSNSSQVDKIMMFKDV